MLKDDDLPDVREGQTTKITSFGVSGGLISVVGDFLRVCTCYFQFSLILTDELESLHADRRKRYFLTLGEVFCNNPPTAPVKDLVQ